MALSDQDSHDLYTLKVSEKGASLIPSGSAQAHSAKEKTKESNCGAPETQDGGVLVTGLLKGNREMWRPSLLRESWAPTVSTVVFMTDLGKIPRDIDP